MSRNFFTEHKYFKDEEFVDDFLYLIILFWYKTKWMLIYHWNYTALKSFDNLFHI